MNRNDRYDRDVEEADRESVRGLSSINFLIGVWMIISPYILNYTSGAAKTNQVIFGIIVLILSAIRFLAPRAAWSSFLNGLVGLWLIIAPFILSYNRTVAYWNEIVFGVLIALIAFSNSSIYPAHHRHHHTTA